MKSGGSKPIPEHLAKRRVPRKEMQPSPKNIPGMQFESEGCVRGAKCARHEAKTF